MYLCPQKSNVVLKNDWKPMILLPTGPGEEQLSWPNINGPKGDWKPNPVQTSTGDLHDILFSLQRINAPSAE
jgi:hypothetical protein